MKSPPKEEKEGRRGHTKKTHYVDSLCSQRRQLS
jgi:hypothetical protein